MAVTLAAPDIGTAHVDGQDIRVQRRPGAHAVWMTMLGPRRSRDITLGSIADLDTDTPSWWIWEDPAAAGWDTPVAHERLLAAVMPLYEADEARRGVA